MAEVLAAVLGALFVVSLVVIAMLLDKNRKLKRRMVSPELRCEALQTTPAVWEMREPSASTSTEARLVLGCGDGPKPPRTPACSGPPTHRGLSTARSETACPPSRELEDEVVALKSALVEQGHVYGLLEAQHMQLQERLQQHASTGSNDVAAATATLAQHMKELQNDVGEAQCKLEAYRRAATEAEQNGEDQRQKIHTLETDNARMRSTTEEMRERHRDELSRMMQDLKAIQTEVGRGRSATDNVGDTGMACELRKENAYLRAELYKEKDEGQLLFLEVERLQTVEAELQEAKARNSRIQSELKMRPVIKVGSPQKHMPPLQPTHTHNHVIQQSMSVVSITRPSPSRNLSFSSSPLPHLKLKKFPPTQSRSEGVLQYKTQALASIDAALGIKNDDIVRGEAADGPVSATKNETEPSVEPGTPPTPSSQQRRPSMLRNPLDNWG
ncbi:hypothetical protein DIPPA_70015 [Diplonema papillatum]|nr:hypothetical protein DIPPA_70015 [Diplonema papillatum]